MKQEQVHKHPHKEPEEVTTDVPQGSETPAGLDDDIDSILGDIDDVLETNAAEFVAAFIQKGGQ